MRINLTRKGTGYHMVATNDTGNAVEMDGSPAIGGQNLGARPMQVVLMALAGCSTVDVLSILKKMKQEPDAYDVVADAKRAEGVEPSPFTDIHLLFVMKGDIEPGKALRAIQLSVDKYCSVAKMLESTARITYGLELNGQLHQPMA